MGLSSSYSTNMVPEDQALAVIHRAKELGITHMDTSDIYGSPLGHENEYLFGKALKGDASAYQIATKFGIVYTPTEFGVNGKKEYVRSCVEGSLKRLGVECIHLYYQHRVDRSTPLEETFGELKALVSEGKIKYVGISEASPAEIKKAHSICPLTAIQIEYSLWSRDVEESIIPTARSLGIGIVAYSPLGRGFLTGQIKSPDELAKDDYRTSGQPRWAPGAFEQNVKLVEKVRELADKKACTPGQLALAWVHSKGDDIFPIPGTKRIQYLEENAAAFHLKLSLAEQEALESIFHPDQVVGGRYEEFVGAMSWTAGAKE